VLATPRRCLELQTVTCFLIQRNCVPALSTKSFQADGVTRFQHVTHQPDYFKDADSGWVADWFSSMLQNPGVRVWVAEVGSVAAGYALTITHDRPENVFCFGPRFCEIDHIAVSPAFRRRGVARALIERVPEDARLRALRDVELTSWCFNGDAHKTFRALGFMQKVIRFGRKEFT
jgi:ribosomal protein S18 acetylase RimI-like enzyme